LDRASFQRAASTNFSAALSLRKGWCRYRGRHLTEYASYKKTVSPVSPTVVGFAETEEVER